jgi:hypothetical protein
LLFNPKKIEGQVRIPLHVSLRSIGFLLNPKGNLRVIKEFILSQSTSNGFSLKPFIHLSLGKAVKLLLVKSLLVLRFLSGFKILFTPEILQHNRGSESLMGYPLEKNVLLLLLFFLIHV